MARIALAQTTSTDDFHANLESAMGMVKAAAAGGAALLAFPEVFLYIGGREGRLQHAQALDGAVVDAFRECAARHAMMILLGSIHERIPGEPEKVYNTSVLTDASGEVLAVYRKLKLFDVELPEFTFRESDGIEPGGADPPVVDTAVGRVGLSICFDLRFADLYLGLRRRGAEVIFVPSNFTAPTGAAHWEPLLRARAIENQAYVAAPAQFGQHNPKYRSHGHTMLVDPWGVVVAQAPERTGLVFGELDLDHLRKVRRELPMAP